MDHHHATNIDAQAALGRAVLTILRERGHAAPPDLDEHGHERRTPGRDGLAAAGLREVRDAAQALGLLPPAARRPTD